MFLRRGFSARLESNNCADYLRHYNALRTFLAKPNILPRASRVHYFTKWFSSSSPPPAKDNVPQDYSKYSYEDLVKESSNKDQEIERIRAELEKNRMKMSEVVEKQIYDKLAMEVSKKKKEVERTRSELEKEKKRSQNLKKEAEETISSRSWSYELDEEMRADNTKKAEELKKKLVLPEKCGISWLILGVTDKFTKYLRSEKYLDSSEDDNAMRSAYRLFLDDSNNYAAQWIIEELKSKDMTIEEFINKCMAAREKSYKTVSGLVTTFRLVRSFNDYLNCLPFDPTPFEEKEKISIDLLARCKSEAWYFEHCRRNRLNPNSDSDPGSDSISESKSIPDSNSISDSSAISDSNSSSDSNPH